ncbi:MAG: lipoyl synthase [Proteobacteria bacterium]|nr:lipoyl synthase [Pseudomonadota bacterium]
MSGSARGRDPARTGPRRPRWAGAPWRPGRGTEPRRRPPRRGSAGRSDRRHRSGWPDRERGPGCPGRLAASPRAYRGVRGAATRRLPLGTRKPPWLKVKLPTGDRAERYRGLKTRARQLSLHTVCEEAQCPNIGECWGGGTATFMVMGDICTRGCRFCAVNTKRNGPPLDVDEPVNVATAIAELGLDYVVLTSVNRDDLEDQGAGHFAACIRETNRLSPKTMVEVLTPDFRGRPELVDIVIEAKPTVFAHNIECVERLTPTVRDPRAGYEQSLSVLRHAKAMGAMTKSSIQVGHGEKPAEVMQCMQDLRDNGTDFLTVGQYLQPSGKHLKVQEFVTPETFEWYREQGEAMGFAVVASGPLVRSSYKAGEFFIRQFLQKTA